ncbi:MAG TPA: phytanoyl-CoA dioxygenase family protein [Burkholderiaceae bacterium]|nr:phytanoyl-CoA dioxygenase family protein [Burkholderiaceae bacterium]
MAGVLTTSQIEQFAQQGYLIVRGMASLGACATMRAIAAEHLRAAVAPLEYEAEVGYDGAPASLDAPGGRTARRLRNAWQRHACFRAWGEDAALVGTVRQLLGEAPCLTLAHHNCVMTKHPDFGTATGWHRDIRYWSFARSELISVWLALGPEQASNGGLKFIPGSHRLQIGRERLDDLDFLRPELAQNQALFAQHVAPALQAGDVVFFHSGLFHAAGRNDSDTVKLSLVFAYRGVSNPAQAGSRSAAAGEICFD